MEAYTTKRGKKRKLAAITEDMIVAMSSTVPNTLVPKDADDQLRHEHPRAMCRDDTQPRANEQPRDGQAIPQESGEVLLIYIHCRQY